MPVVALLAQLAILLPGCPAPGKTGAVQTGSAAKAAQLDLDPAKAFLTLSQLEPEIPKPKKPASPAPLSARASRQLSKAADLLAEQRYTEAAIELERALRYDPNHPEIHRTLAMLHWEAGNLERAKVHVARALEGNPDDAAAYYIKGRCATLEGNHATALTAYRTALLCSDFGADRKIAAQCHYHLARALAGAGYLEAALAQYAAFEKLAGWRCAVETPEEGVAAVAPTRESVAVAKSRILEKLGRFSQAADMLAPFAASPDEAELGLRRARLLARAGRFDEALAAARIVPADGEELVDLLFEIYEATGRSAEVLEGLRGRIINDPDDSRHLLDLVEMLIRLKRVGEARRELQNHLAQHDRDYKVRAKLVDMLIAARDWEEGLGVCAAGIERHPEHATEFERRIRRLAALPEAVDALLDAAAGEETSSASYLRGVLAAEAGRLETAERFLRRSYEADPRSVATRYALAEAYLRMYRYDEALQVAGRAEQEDPEDARLEMILGEVYERLDDTDRAELHFKAAMQLDRTDTGAMFALAKLYSRTGRALQAQRQLQVLLEKDPAHEQARELLAATYFEEGKPDVAIEQFEELRRRAASPITRARCTALLNHVHKRDTEAYRRTLLEAIKEHGADAAVWIALAESYNPDDDPEKRRDAYRNALALDPDREEAILGLVQASQRLLDFEGAAGMLRSLLPRRPNRHIWKLGLADLYWTLQDYDAALSLLREAAARADLKEPWRRRYRLAILETLQQAGRQEEAVEELQRWAAAEPQPDTWSELLAREYIRQKQPLKAVAIYEAIQRADPNDAESLWPLVDALVAAGRYDRACQHTLDRLEDDPENESTISRLIRVLGRAKRYEEALELIRNRLLRTFAREHYQDLTIRILAQAERYDACADFIEELIDEVMALMHLARDAREFPDDDELTCGELLRRPNEPFTLARLHQRLMELRLSLVGVLIVSKEVREAERQLSSWLDASRDPGERFEYLTRLALCHRQLGDEALANEVLARALLLRPGDITLNNDVAYDWISKGIRLEEAERMIRYAVSERPRRAAYLDTYGWLQYKKGRFTEAKKWLLRAAGALDEEDPVILDHLGDTLWQLSKADEAVRYWKAAVAALGKRGEKELSTRDERNVRDATPQKIVEAEAGRTPAVAPLATESPPEGD